MGAVDPTKGSTMTTEHDDTGFEPPHTSSPTDHVLAELQLYGYRPFQDEPDPRPLPEAQAVAGAVADIFDALVVTLGDTRLEPSKICSGRPSTSSIAPPTGSSANSTTTSRRKSVASGNRTAPRSARSNSNASPQRVKR